MPLPTFFVPGAAKSGTSALHTYLSQHPNIFMSKQKEPHFFSHDEKYRKGIHEYSQLFVGGKNHLVRGESSTGYMVFPNTIERIATHIVAPQFIFVLRNPIDRAYSHYWWLKGLGYEAKSFRDAILEQKELEPDPDKALNGNYKFYFQYGSYSKWLGRFLDRFERSSFLILSTEELYQDPLPTLNSCYSFLNVPLRNELATVYSNQTVILKRPGLYNRLMTTSLTEFWFGKYMKSLVPQNLRTKWRTQLGRVVKQLLSTSDNYVPMSFEDRQWLTSLYQDDVERLRGMTQQSFSHWEKDFPQSNGY